MLLFYKLLFLCVILGIYSKPHHGSREVNKLIGKIINAHRFSELADAIADRALVKTNVLQQPNTKNNINKTIVHGSPKLRAKENLDVTSRSQKNHKHGNINIEAVLKNKVIPADSLHLRYKHLKQRNHNIGRSYKSETHEETSQGEGSNDKDIIINREGKSMSSLSEENQDYQEIAEQIKHDFEENIKTRSDETFDNPFGDGKNISWRKKQSSQIPFEIDLNLREKGLREGPRKGFRTEGNKTFTFEESPDYKDYLDNLATVAK